MSIQQIIVPASLALSGSSVLVAAYCLRGFSSIKKQIQELADNHGREISEHGKEIAEHAKEISGKVKPETVAELAKQIEGFRSRVDDLERRKNFAYEAAAVAAAAGPQIPSHNAAPGNTNRRSQIMRLHRSGESISSIASALGVSQGEVKLIVKVQEMLAENGNADRPSDFL
jgi:DNA-binding NarL/FixJ family response regulator